MAEKCDTDFVENSCRRFVVILPVDCSSSNASTSSNSIGGSVISASSRSKSSQSSNSKQLDPLILLDALVDMLADENRVHSKAALNVFSETLSIHTHVKHADVLIARGGHNASVIVSSPSTNSVYSSHPSVRITAFEQLLHGSYGSTWQAQVGGVMGVGKVNVESLCYFQVKIMRGLVEVLAPVYASKELKERSQVLMQILASHVVNNVDEANSEARRKSFQDVIEYLATWLLNRNAYIAAVLASQTGSEVTELLEPSYQLLLQPLILCPLRCTTVEQQVGTFAALIFCVASKPPLLKVTPELVNFLQEALQIDEADETVWAVKLMNPQVLRSLNRVRTACIEFLSTTIAWVNFRMQTYTEVPAKVNSMFFKSLTCRDPDHIVAVAKEGLRQGKAIHGKIDLKEKHEAFKAKLHSMQAVQWTRSLGILMEGVGELLAANKVKHVPTRVKWMTNLGRRCCFIFNLLYLLKAEAIHEPEKVESRGATNFVTYLWIVVLLFVCVSPLIYFLWRSLKQKPPPESTSPESTSLPDPKLIVADKPKTQKKKKKILSEPPAAFLEANKRFEPYVDCLDSFEASDRLPPKDLLRKAWNRTSVGKLTLLEKVIEQRDDSAVVEGFLEKSRPVFIKCGLRSEEMENEIAVLISADYHPNIIRYFISEFEDNHFYYSLESWVCNLSSLVKYFGKQNSSDSELVYLGIQNLWTTTGAPSTHLISLIRDVVLGLEHLHSLDIIHRDLRPENVMIVHAGKTPIAKIGNMDIARIKEAPLLSHHARGERSPGFQPREQFENEKETTAVDMFALGCIMFYVISSGKHPFGAVNKRKANIRRNNCDLRPIQNFPEAYDLIQHLVDSEPNSRLIASQVLLHPFFWNYDVKLDFFMKVSDYAVEVNWLLSTELDALSLGTAIGDTSWDGKVDDIFLDHNNKYSARHANASMTSYVQTMKDYNYAKISDLLRVIRNTQHHYGRLPKDIRAIFPDGVYKYFDGLFPKLFMEVYKVVYPKYKKADEFKQFFKEI
ncbi:uncharacterized protein LOC110228095 [Arabidopsis lyrata subsp. lyrata]|uniref:uncharacterized protein LOC110228095 n=1 Tax=Arabidopsis lyrata subsp. lyrata TaxID=81972 RepID=UPI000A29E836|nr:uncharacterized protein LOC110228095 [Arabidopsis lyrata subsp. lyrata]|eukprot:XP_020879904.1 uncharacterized protein LOC110228095 [Arabidopsis lyrata subsp. lyrata]